MEQFKPGAVGQLEPLDKKAQRLEDFVKIVEDKHYIMGELFGKYEHMEGFLKRLPGPEQDLKLQCLPNLQKRAQFVNDCGEELLTFVEDLEEVQRLEQYLTFDPLVDVTEKLQKLRHLNIKHAQQLVESQHNAQEVEQLVITYNEIIDRLNAQMKYLEEQVLIEKS